ncbi:protein PET117 homolog, mitochondrial-like [Acanthaster planci]|uniref:Protein PET117 homolog, mitochondrial-like n=1 Tax=Acanthaster planci TaxID=133434 RepID=A0A8B7YZK3_ACAPL|nr:protein PET117 homolog, mitochondrial-like [Acanthaster planci]
MEKEKMSTGSKVSVAASVVIAAGIIAGVHYKKKSDQARLRQGVQRDLERQRRKQQNRRDLEEQIALTKQLEEARDRREQNLTS